MMQEERSKISSVVAVPEKKVNDDINKSFWRLNEKMIPCKLHFFLFVGGEY